MSCDCERPSCGKREVRRARKPHRCDECRGTIAARETYVYHSWIWDGTPDSCHLHVECDVWRTALEGAIRERPELGLCDCIGIGGLAEAMREYGGGDSMPAWLLRFFDGDELTIEFH